MVYAHFVSMLPAPTAAIAKKAVMPVPEAAREGENEVETTRAGRTSKLSHHPPPQEKAMFTKSITTLSVVALLVVSGSATAQLGALNMTLTPSQGVPGVYAIVGPNANVKLNVDRTQNGLDAGLTATIQIWVSPINVLGELDLENAMLLTQGAVASGDNYGLQFLIPAILDNTAWSLLAVAFFEDGSVATSDVLTVIINSFLISGEPQTDPL